MVWIDWPQRFKEHLRKHRLSQASLADELKTTPGAISHWLTGRNKINLEDFFSLCSAAGADPLTILFGSSVDDLARQRLSALLDTHPEENPRYRTFEEAMEVHSRKKKNTKARAKPVR